ncbi:MAG TPA: CHAP domain-containing protein, partial [Candidatus Binatia bacterium]|nr:CHAP domain-containing protein [Candidatus Binatia bacterium]
MAALRLLSVPMSVVVLAVLVAAGRPALAAEPAPTPQAGATLPGVQPSAQSGSFSVDAVSVTVSSRFLPARNFVVSKKGDLSQTASSSTPRPYADLSVTTVPYGTKPGTEALPVAKQGAAAEYRAQLQSDRQKQGAQVTTGPAASLFGNQVTSQVAVVTSAGMAASNKPVVVVEWVAEAGNRIWLVRASAQVDAADQPGFVGALSDLRVQSSDPNRPTTIATPQPGTKPTAPTSPAPSPPRPSPGQSGRGAGPSDLSAAPSWWSGDCDYDHYAAGSGQGSFRLGATYLGMPACGPRPIAGGVDVLVNFYPGAWGEFEWECVELVMRYLYQGFGIPPYGANGNQVVSNYQGSELQKIANPTQGVAPQPGDVLSYGPDTTFGHASVVAASNVDSSGNGSITVVEENNSPGGTSTLDVSGWYVQGFETVSGWLHPLVPMGATPKPAGPETSWGPDRLDVVMAGSDGAAWHRGWAPGWSPWESRGAAPASEPIAVSWGSNRLDIFARGGDNALWHTAWYGSGWSGWDSLGGQFYGDPDVVSWGSNRLDVFVRGIDNQLWHRGWSGQQWSGWEGHGGSLA